MAEKRKHCDAPRHTVTTTYFIAMACKWEPTDSRFNSHKKLILDAHQWGEMRVHSELLALELLNFTARARFNMFTTMSEKWYTTGYRMYLLPDSKQSPDALRHRPRTNVALMKQTESSLRDLATQAGATWRAKYSSAIGDDVLAAASTSSPAPTAPTSSPAPAAPIAPAAPAAPIAAPLARRSPPASQALPQVLARFLAEPSKKLESSPRSGIEAAVSSAFHEQRALCAWGTGLSFAARPANALQSALEARGLQVVYGGEDEDMGREAMRRVGLCRLAGGAYNTVWAVSDRGAPQLTELFGTEAGTRLIGKQLILRSPRPKTGWLTFEQAVGEATNMLFTAMCGFGPRVALLSYASTARLNEKGGGSVLKYKIFALLERATESIDKRYAPESPMLSSAASSSSYIKALLVCIFQFSHEGFVHLDGTLRNFVDCYPPHLPTHLSDWSVKVIDVDQKSFRRLCPQASSGWRDLFLINLLVVFTFLKLRLGKRWDHERHWSVVSLGVAQLLRDIPGRTTLPSIAFWEGDFVVDAPFPDMNARRYAASTHQAASRFLLRQMRYYLVEQPLEQCSALYVDVRLGPKANPHALPAAMKWYDECYRTDIYPAHRYFRDALQPRENGKPRLFAGVLYKFLNEPHANLRSKYADTLRPSSTHAVFGGSVSREEMLGV